jgi:AcrR family transcriptional regulator
MGLNAGQRRAGLGWTSPPARSVGLSRPTLYHQIKSRENLIGAVLSYQFDRGVHDGSAMAQGVGDSVVLDTLSTYTTVTELPTDQGPHPCLRLVPHLQSLHRQRHDRRGPAPTSTRSSRWNGRCWDSGLMSAMAPVHQRKGAGHRSSPHRRSTQGGRSGRKSSL